MLPGTRYKEKKGVTLFMPAKKDQKENGEGWGRIKNKIITRVKKRDQGV
jgi:hypothetical protein